MTPLVLAMTLGATWNLSVQRAEVAQSCPDEARLRRGIAERLGRDPFIDVVPPLPTQEPGSELANPFDASKRPVDEHRTLSVQFTRDSSRYLATVALVDRLGRRTGTRELSSTAGDCSELAGAVVLAATIVIDPMVLSRPPPVVDAGVPPEWNLPPLSRPPDAMRPPPVKPREPSAEPIPQPLPEPVAPIPLPPSDLPPLPRPPEPVRTNPVPTREPRPALKPLNAIFLGAGAGASIGQVPEVAVVGTIQASWGTRSSLLTLSADLTSPGARKVGTGNVSALLFSGVIDGCAKWGWFGGCAAASLGTFQAWSSGLLNPRPQGALFVAVGAGAVLDIPAGELLRVRIGVRGWYQPSIILDVGGVPVWASTHFAFTATATVHFKLWGDLLP